MIKMFCMFCDVLWIVFRLVRCGRGAVDAVPVQFVAGEASQSVSETGRLEVVFDWAAWHEDLQMFL